MVTEPVGMTVDGSDAGIGVTDMSAYRYGSVTSSIWSQPYQGERASRRKEGLSAGKLQMRAADARRSARQSCSTNRREPLLTH